MTKKDASQPEIELLDRQGTLGVVKCDFPWAFLQNERSLFPG